MEEDPNEVYNYVLYIHGENARGILKGRATRKEVRDLVVGMEERNPDWVILAEEVDKLGA